MKQKIEQFCSKTSIHGFSNMQDYKPGGRLFWMLFLWMIFAVLAFHLSTIFLQFSKFPYYEKVTFSKERAFPNIQVCPLEDGYDKSIILNHVSKENEKYWKIILGGHFFTQNFSRKHAGHLRSKDAKYSNLNKKQRENLKILPNDLFIYAIYRDKLLNTSDFRYAPHP